MRPIHTLRQQSARSPTNADLFTQEHETTPKLQQSHALKAPHTPPSNPRQINCSKRQTRAPPTWNERLIATPAKPKPTPRPADKRRCPEDDLLDLIGRATRRRPLPIHEPCRSSANQVSRYPKLPGWQKHELLLRLCLSCLPVTKKPKQA